MRLDPVKPVTGVLLRRSNSSNSAEVTLKGHSWYSKNELLSLTSWEISSNFFSGYGWERVTGSLQEKKTKKQTEGLINVKATVEEMCLTTCVILIHIKTLYSFPK